MNIFRLDLLHPRTASRGIDIWCVLSFFIPPIKRERTREMGVGRWGSYRKEWKDSTLSTAQCTQTQHFPQEALLRFLGYNLHHKYPGVGVHARRINKPGRVPLYFPIHPGCHPSIRTSTLSIALHPKIHTGLRERKREVGVYVQRPKKNRAVFRGGKGEKHPGI